MSRREMPKNGTARRLAGMALAVAGLAGASVSCGPTVVVAHLATPAVAVPAPIVTPTVTPTATPKRATPQQSPVSAAPPPTATPSPVPAPPAPPDTPTPRPTPVPPTRTPV